MIDEAKLEEWFALWLEAEKPAPCMCRSSMCTRMAPYYATQDRFYTAAREAVPTLLREVDVLRNVCNYPLLSNEVMTAADKIRELHDENVYLTRERNALRAALAAESLRVEAWRTEAESYKSACKTQEERAKRVEARADVQENR